MLTIGGTTIGSAVSVSMDMNEGIIARFRTMASTAARCSSGTSSAA